MIFNGRNNSSNIDVDREKIKSDSTAGKRRKATTNIATVTLDPQLKVFVKKKYT